MQTKFPCRTLPCADVLRLFALDLAYPEIYLGMDPVLFVETLRGATLVVEVYGWCCSICVAAVDCAYSFGRVALGVGFSRCPFGNLREVDTVLPLVRRSAPCH